MYRVYINGREVWNTDSEQDAIKEAKDRLMQAKGFSAALVVMCATVLHVVIDDANSLTVLDVEAIRKATKPVASFWDGAAAQRGYDATN